MHDHCDRHEKKHHDYDDHCDHDNCYCHKKCRSLRKCGIKILYGCDKCYD
jgi:hypothetical protein